MNVCLTTRHEYRMPQNSHFRIGTLRGSTAPVRERAFHCIDRCLESLMGIGSWLNRDCNEAITFARCCIWQNP